MMHERYMFDGGSMFNGFIIWMLVACVAMVVVIVIGVVLVVRAISRRDERPHSQYTTNSQSAPHTSSNDQAIQILKERLAKGEIDHDEYDELLIKIKNS